MVEVSRILIGYSILGIIFNLICDSSFKILNLELMELHLILILNVNLLVLYNDVNFFPG